MKSILICDDNSDVREVLELMLKSLLEVEIVHSANGVEGIAMCSDRFDLIISDYNMPKKNGEDLFDHNFQNEKIPFLLLDGGQVPKSFITKVKAQELAKVLEKPCRDHELISVVKELISLRGHRN